MKKKIIWISGTSGFVGKHLKKYLSKFDKYQVVPVSNSKKKNKDVLSIDYSSVNNIRKVLSQNKKPDIFLHLGWGNVYDPHHSSHVNKNLSEGKNLFETFYKNGITKIILLGSSSEYGDLCGALKENTKINTYQNLYVKGKVKLCNYGLEKSKFYNKLFLHIRLFYAYGEGQRKNSLINQLYSSGRDGKIIKLTPCEHFRDYIYIDDVVVGIEKLISFKKSEVVNLGSGKAIVLKKFIEIFWKKMKRDTKLLGFGKINLPEKQQSQPKAFADLSKLYDLTKWKPSISINDGIKKTIMRLSNLNII